MKKIVTLLLLFLPVTSLLAQQSPLSENYFQDKYSLAPSYAGNYNIKYLFLGYRSEWTGISGGPKTFRMSYNDALMQNAGYGGKIVYDKTGIFCQLYITGSYSYKLKILDDHYVLFGLSAGIYHNSLNLTEYYNDPTYNLDPSLIQQDVSSKIKFISDVSVVYLWKELNAGLTLSNISFGDASYKEVNLKYNPITNFQLHASYLYSLAEDWGIVPLVIVRGGKYIKSQFEIASQVVWQKKIMASLAFRDPGVFGIGLGANISKGLKIGYNFNFASGVVLQTFNNHEISLGINFSEYIGKSK